ncbi:MAG: recombinase family protein [Christensenellales bacterium]
MADLYFRCGSKSEADSLVESAREFAEKHEMSIEHVIFDRQDGRTIMLNMYADSAVYREPTTLLVRNYACLGNSEIQRLTMHKKLVRNGLTVVFEGGSPIADERKLILHTIKSYYSCGDEWERKYAGESQSAQVRTEPFPGAKYAMPVPFGYRFENGAPIADPAESVVVRKIFEMYRHGTGVIEIAKEANRLLADIRNENGQNTADAKQLTRHNVYAMVENNRYFGIEEKDGFAPYPAIVPNYLRLYAARINRQRKEKAEAGHRFMFANILPVGLGTVLQTVNIASPYKPEIRFYCENGKIIVDAVRFENAIYDALWMQLRNGSERMERAVRRYIAENRKTAEATRNDVYSRLEMIREEINRIGENGWSESLMPI